MAPCFDFTSNEEPFLLDGLLEIHDLVSEPNSICPPLYQASNLFTLGFGLAEKRPLPQLRAEVLALDHEPLPELDSVVPSTSASEVEDAASNDGVTQHDEDLEDLWSLKDVISDTAENQLFNWDTFLNPQAERPRSAYLSEAGPAAVDAVLASDALRTNTGLPKLVAQHDDFLRSLFELGAGRDSLLYRYDQMLPRFVRATEDFGLSGISFEVLQDVVDDVLQMGNCLRQIKAFLAEPKHNPLSIALESAISAILYTVVAELETTKREIQSILQVRDLFYRPSCLVHTLQRLVKVVTTTERSRDIILQLAHESEILTSRHYWQAPLLHEIMGRVSAPWICAVEAEVGLRPGPTASEIRTLLPIGGIEAQEQMSAGCQETPLENVEEVVTESRRCLAVLRAWEPEHPVLNPSSKSHLSWQMSWEAIARIQMQTNEYEQALQREVVKYGQGKSNEAHHRRHSEVDLVSSEEEERPILINLDATNVLDRDLGGRPSFTGSRLSQLTTAALTAYAESSEPLPQSELCPLVSQSLSLSLTPLLAAQSRLLSFSTVHLLFQTHSLRAHLSVQHRFQLLSDGSFASRLSRALFDPDQPTGEGRRATEGTTGLRLQARGSWPPASSELRLVLIGILSESYHGTVGSRGHNNSDLPGNLSFAIRDLSAEELEKCGDVGSIEALDFLRLQYKAPPVLETVITQSSLRKYDKVFKYRLRLLRMQAVAQGLLRDAAGRNGKVNHTSQRFKIEIQHFVCSLAAYSSNDVIDVEWSRFQELLRNIEAAIDRSDYEGTIAMAGSLSRLEQLHEDVLNRIIEALFLSRRQAQVRDVIDGILRLVLRFASNVRQSDKAEGIIGTEEIHTEFRRQVGKLVRYLHSQGSAATARRHGPRNQGLRTDGEPPFEHFLLRLDMSGYIT